LVAIGASVGLLVSTSSAVALAEGKERKQKVRQDSFEIIAVTCVLLSDSLLSS